MDWKLELIIIPVSDVDVAKAFYTEQVGFDLLMDVELSEDRRVARLIPPGSKCGIAIGTGMTDAEPGSATGMHLMVDDVVAARDELVARGVSVHGPYHFVDGLQAHGVSPKRTPFNSFLDFADPDGNVWIVQEVPAGS
jgi:catechol 2,3-dioxygenase-like lactoylglutathione lyase family enzyme